MFYPFIVAAVDLYQNLLGFFLSFFKMPFLLLSSNSLYLAVFLKNVISAVMILDSSCSYSVQFSAPYIGVGTAS
jgi:hypothetical protein